MKTEEQVRDAMEKCEKVTDLLDEEELYLESVGPASMAVAFEWVLGDGEEDFQELLEEDLKELKERQSESETDGESEEDDE